MLDTPSNDEHLRTDNAIVMTMSRTLHAGSTKKLTVGNPQMFYCLLFGTFQYSDIYTKKGISETTIQPCYFLSAEKATKKHFIHCHLI